MLMVRTDCVTWEMIGKGECDQQSKVLKINRSVRNENEQANPNAESRPNWGEGENERAKIKINGAFALPIELIDLGLNRTKTMVDGEFVSHSKTLMSRVHCALLVLLVRFCI